MLHEISLHAASIAQDWKDSDESDDVLEEKSMGRV